MKRITPLRAAGWIAFTMALGFLSHSVVADDAAPLRLDFQKSLASPGPAPYVATFHGSVSGDINGCLVTRVTRREQLADGKVELEAEYAVYDGECLEGADPLFVMAVGGKSSHNHYVLNGEIIEGSLEGAQVHLEFDAVACEPGKVRCFAGTIQVMTGSAE